jgi:hypothetical protein
MVKHSAMIDCFGTAAQGCDLPCDLPEGTRKAYDTLRWNGGHVKKLVLLLVLFGSLLFVAPVQHVVAQQPTVQLAEDPQSTTVYITKTGKKYHKDGCRYLSQSKIKTTLKEAKANGYTPCKVCHPPQ